MEGLKESETNLVVYLHPSKAKCASDSILSDLSSMLYTYSETFEGVVLAYDPNICSKLAKILPGIHLYFGVKLKARLLVFNPTPDMLLEGEVVKITPQLINAVVLGFSSTFIADEDIREDFKHKIGLKESETNLVVYLHPFKAKCANDAILSDLSSLLYTYSETFEGVVLAYDVNICSKLAKILPGIHPYFGVKLKARLLLFIPTSGMLLEGEVVKITPQSINAVVLGFSSDFIAYEDIREDFKHKIVSVFSLVSKDFKHKY